MASITSLGTGSGLDLEGLVTKLMTAEKVPITTIQTKETKEQTKLSAWGKVKSALSDLATATDALGTRSKFSSYKGTVADSSVAGVSLSSLAAAGSYSLEVTHLAAAQKIKSAGYADTSTAITANDLPATLTLEIGTTTDGAFSADSTKTKTITINSSNNTLADLRDAINATKAGVTASLINDGGSTPYHLVITSDSTGAANSFKLSGLSDLSYNPATATGSGLSSITTAADAKLSLDGIEVTSSSNTVTNAINGVTLTLNKTNEGSATKLTVAADNSAIETKVQAFVTAYNAVNTLIKDQTSYDTSTKVAGTLNGDSTVSAIQSQLRSIITSAVGSGATNRLAEIGIQFQKDGSLKVDSTKFQNALSNASIDVAGLFAKDVSTGTTGIASQLSSAITSMLGTDGLLTARTDGIQDNIDDMDDRITVLEDRMTTIEARYRAQFSALDTLVANLNTSASYLTQMLKSLDNSNS